MSTYLDESRLVSADRGQSLGLATASGLTPSGLVNNPVFFTGFVDRPDVFAAGLLAVADVAAARYADFGLMKRVLNLDPVVTGSGDRLRFESFSACNGVQARFDVLADGLGGNDAAFGTTNIDINLPLRMALATINQAEALHLTVGSRELRASTPSATHVERKVSLPDKWIRGLAEVPVVSASMRPFAEVAKAKIPAFIAQLPRVAPPGPTIYVLPRGSGWLLSPRAAPGAAKLAGASRLRGMERVLRHASALRIFTADSGASAWVFELPGSRLTLTLSPEPYRGFAGEGGLLTLLAKPEAASVGAELLGHIGWSSRVDPRELAERSGKPAVAVAAGLAWLAASGRLGYDLVDQSWFHRELPIDAEKVLRRNPRLVSAQKLVDAGEVRPEGSGWRVRGNHRASYFVNEQSRCECTWEAEHHGSRGPCKHILAALLIR
jgi:hypothetical protein